MGKGTIISGGIGGEYSIQIEHLVTELNANIAKNTASLATVNEQIAAETDANKLTALKLKKASLLANQKYLQDLATKINTTGWCVDVTEDMVGTVGTIEVPGERGSFVNLHSDNAYSAARDGQLEKAGAGKTAGVIWNLAMLPGWQKWKPTYRYATITALNISEIEGGTDYCDVTLEASLSTQQSLDVNQATTLSNVEIDYMDCNGAGFQVGDVVVVQFTSQNWNSPKVIGYKTEPKYCHPIVMISVTLRRLKVDYYLYPEHNEYTEFIGSAVMVWDPKNDKLLKGPVSAADADFLKWYGCRDVVASTNVSGSECGTIDNYYGCLDMAAMMTPEGFYQPSGCQLLVPGGQDYYKKSPNGVPYPHVLQYHIQAANRNAYPTEYSEHPRSAYINAIIGDNAEPTITGIRTESDVDGVDSEAYSSIVTYKHTYHTPFGSTTRETYIEHGDVGGGQYGYLYDFYLQDMYSGFDFKLQLSYNKRVFVNICVRQHMYVHYHAGPDPALSETEPREIFIEGNALYDRNSVYGVDWIAAGRNSSFEAAVKAAIEQTYVLAGITDNYVREAYLSIQFLR